jgi:hypothetical protein
MANECMNYISIKGDNELLKVFADSYLKKEDNGDYGLDFNIIAPIPKNCENDYTFRIDNWGNKWDGTHGYVEFYQDDKYIESEIFIDVSTAWGPCDKITYKLISLCPGLYFYHEYYEGGEGFAGWIEHHPDEGPDDYEDVYYNVSQDSYHYWYWMFEKEFENFDWLYDHLDWLLEDEEISKEVCETGQKMIKDGESIESIVNYCIAEGVL